MFQFFKNRNSTKVLKELGTIFSELFQTIKSGDWKNIRSVKNNETIFSLVATTIIFVIFVIIILNVF